MNKKQKINSLKRIQLITILTITLLLLVLGFYLFRTRLIVPSAEVAGPSLALIPASKQVNLNETFNVDISINTDNQNVASVDIFHLNFDPQFFEVIDADSGAGGTQIQSGNGNIFPVIYQNNVDTNTGQIAFNAGKNIDGSGSFNGNGVLATIAFRALKEGTTNVTFNFTPGQTNDCNIVLDTADGFPPDILVGVANGTFTIGNPSASTPTPSATVSTNSGTGTKHTSRPASPSALTPTPTQEQPPAEPIVEEPVSETPIDPQNTLKSTPIAGLASPLSSPRSSSSPTKTPSSSPTSSPTETKLAGSSISLMVNLLFYIGAPALTILISYLIWIQIKRKKREKSSKNNGELNFE